MASIQKNRDILNRNLTIVIQYFRGFDHVDLQKKKSSSIKLIFHGIWLVKTNVYAVRVCILTIYLFSYDYDYFS